MVTDPGVEPPNEALRRRAVKGAGWTAVQVWGSRLVSTVVFLLLARLLEPRQFGVVALAAVFTAFLEVLVNMGFADALVQRADLDDDHLQTAWWTSIGAATVIALATVAGAGPLGQLTGEPRIVPVVRALALGFLLAAANTVPNALLRRRLRFRAIAVRFTVANLLSGAFAIALALAGAGVWALVAKSLVQTGIGLVLSLANARWRPRLRFSRERLRDLLPFGAKATGINVLQFTGRHTDDLLIGSFIGVTALGFYSVAYQLLIIILTVVTSTIDLVALPTFARLQDDRPRMARGYLTAVRMSSLLGFLVFAATAALAPELVRTLFGTKWRRSVPVMQILALSAFLAPSISFAGTVLKAAGRPGLKLLTAVAQAVATVVGFVVVVVVFDGGIVAVAAVFTAETFLLAPLELWALRQVIDLPTGALAGSYVGPALGAVAFAAVVAGLRWSIGDAVGPWPFLAVAGVTATAAYLGVVRVVDRATLAEAVRHAGALRPG